MYSLPLYKQQAFIYSPVTFPALGEGEMQPSEL